MTVKIPAHITLVKKSRHIVALLSKHLSHIPVSYTHLAVANNNHTGNNKIFPAILKTIISTSFSLRTVACRDLPLLYNSFQSLMVH